MEGKLKEKNPLWMFLLKNPSVLKKKQNLKKNTSQVVQKFWRKKKGTYK